MAVLSEFGLLDRLRRTEYGEEVIGGVQRRAEHVRKDFGSFLDVGDFDSDSARKKLSYYWNDWRISDTEAIDVVKMFESAPTQTGRDAILARVLDMGKLGRLAKNLPWRTVQQLHDATTEPRVKAELFPYYKEHIEKDPGESLSAMYDRLGVEQARKMQESGFLGTLIHGGASYGFAFLHTLHNAATFGFLDTYSQAYDLHQQGLISDDALIYTTSVALVRTGVSMAATVLSGGTAGGLASGTARSLGMSRGGAAVLGNITGGSVAGLTGTFSSDLINIAFLQQKGLSAGKDYLLAAGIGAALGGVGAAAEVRFPESAKATASIYAEKYPWLKNLVEASERSGLQTGHAMLRSALLGGSQGPFPKSWTSMTHAEQKAFQHAYSRHASDFELPSWAQTNAEALRAQFNAKVSAVRDAAIYSIEMNVPFGVKGSGAPGGSTRVRMYVSSDGTNLFYYYETVSNGQFVSSGKLPAAFTPGADSVLSVMPPLPFDAKEPQ
jgi:hypothetical protein